MTADTTSLQAEISRQQVIINILIEKNQQLERQLAFAHSQLESGAEKNLQDQPTVVEVTPNYFAGTSTPHFLMTEKPVGTSHLGALPANFSVVTLRNEEMTPEEYFVISHYKTLTKTKRFAISWSEEQWAAFCTDPAPTIPAPIAALLPTVPGNLAALHRLAQLTTPKGIYHVLRRAMPELHRDGLFNTATLLHHLLASPKNSYPELMRLLKFSESGVAKILAALKKKGLLVATGHQRFALTPLALRYVWEARAVS